MGKLVLFTFPPRNTEVRKSLSKTYLSRTQAGPGRAVKEQHKQTSPNHVQELFLSSVEEAVGKIRGKGQGVNNPDVTNGRPLNCYADDGRESQINLSLKPPPFLFFAARSGAHFRGPLRLPGGVRSRSVAGGRVSPVARRHRNQGTQFNGKIMALCFA